MQIFSGFHQPQLFHRVSVQRRDVSNPGADFDHLSLQLLAKMVEDPLVVVGDLGERFEVLPFVERGLRPAAGRWTMRGDVSQCRWVLRYVSLSASKLIA